MMHLTIGGISDLMRWGNFISTHCLCSLSLSDRCTVSLCHMGDDPLPPVSSFPMNTRCILLHQTGESPKTGTISSSLDWGFPQGRGWASSISRWAPQRRGPGPLCVLPLLGPGSWNSQHNDHYLTHKLTCIGCGSSVGGCNLCCWLPSFLDVPNTPHPSPGIFPRGCNSLLQQQLKG